MGLFDKLRNELIDIIEWMSDSSTTIAWRFPRHQNEIKNGAQLIVRPGQVAVFVHEGKLADVFEEGHHELATKNLPVLSTLQGWKHGFESPFKSEVYFVSSKQITDLKWGTPKPIMMRDPDFGKLRIRAFGTYSLRVIDPKILIRELVGTDGTFNADELTELLRSIIQSAFVDFLGEAKVPALDLASKYNELSDDLRKYVCERIDDEYGLDVPMLRIVNISLPDEVEKALDTSSSIAALGDMGRYQQYQMANAIPDMATNKGGMGGGIGAGMGMGMGVAMGNQMAGMMQPIAAAPPQQPAAAPPPPPPGAAPPPPPQAAMWHITVGGQTQGPYDVNQVAQFVAAGQLTAGSNVWSAGMPSWAPAGQVPQLAHLFATPPPPPPGPPPPPAK